MDSDWLHSNALQFALSSISSVTAPSSGILRSAGESLRLMHVARGDCSVRIGEAQERLAGDRMLLILGQAAYSIVQTSQDLLLSQVDFSHMPYVPPAQSLHEMYSRHRDYCLLCQAGTAYHVFHDRFSLVRFTVKNLPQYATFESPFREKFLSMTLNYLMQVIAAAVQEKAHHPCPSSRHIRRAIQYIHENYMRRINAEDIASYVGIHTGHLHRLFRTEIGTRVTAYLTHLRMEKAKTLLKRTDIPIAEIAELVGISTQQYLSRVFRQQVGMTPQEYRRSYNITCDYSILQQRYEPTAYTLSAQEEGTS